MPFTKTPGGQAPSEKFLKQNAAAKGLGADNAPAHSEARAPGQAPVASDSGVPGVEGTAEEALENSGNINATNEPGMTGLKPAVPGGAAKGPNVAGA